MGFGMNTQNIGCGSVIRYVLGHFVHRSLVTICLNSRQCALRVTGYPKHFFVVEAHAPWHANWRVVFGDFRCLGIDAFDLVANQAGIPDISMNGINVNSIGGSPTGYSSGLYSR